MGNGLQKFYVIYFSNRLELSKESSIQLHCIETLKFQYVIAFAWLWIENIPI